MAPPRAPVLPEKVESVKVHVPAATPVLTPPPWYAESVLVLLETVQRVSVRLSSLARMPAPPAALPPVTVRSDIVKLPLPGIWRSRTRLALLPLTVTPTAGPMIETESVTAISPEVRVIVRGVVKNAGSKVMASGPGLAFAAVIIWRRLPAPLSARLVTV